MHVVIDVPNWLYNAMLEHKEPIYSQSLAEAVRDGTPLPKGHGRIMDVDKIIKKMEEREECLKDNRSMYETACVETALDMFGDTIVEADTESEDEE